MNLTTEQQERADLIKATIQQLQKHQDELFEQLVDELNFIEEIDKDALFDYIFNN